ncbi:hypothetical protein [Arthrobacter sp. AD-310]
MTPSSPVLRAVSATASAAVLALSLSLPAGGPAYAESPEPTGTATTAPGCSEGCTQEPTATSPDDPRPGKTTRPEDDPQPDQPAAPQPTAPSVPAPEAPARTVDMPAADVPEEPAATETTAEETPGPGATTPATGSPSSTSNWNVPVTRSSKATQAASVSRQGDGPLGPDLPAIATGLLLVGVGGGTFAWWGRNRLRAH